MSRTVEIFIVQDTPEDGGLFSAIAPKINWASAYGETKEEAADRLVNEVIPLMIEALIEGYQTNEVPDKYIEKQEREYYVA